MKSHVWKTFTKYSKDVKLSELRGEGSKYFWRDNLSLEMELSFGREKNS